MRGTALLKDWEARLVADREAGIVTARCAFCKWELEGTVADSRTAYLAHRLQAHPEVKPPARRKRQRPFGQLSNRRTLDENIANARGQGASTWAGDL